MRRVRVESTTVGSLGYDVERRMLEVEFLEDGDVYRYFDVPAWEFDQFLAAESKGRYLNQVFKPAGYAFERVER